MTRNHTKLPFHILKANQFILSLFLFVFINVGLYAFSAIYHDKVSLNVFNYSHGGTHHYLSDPRIENLAKFNFLRSWGSYDGQWYLEIAEQGYPRKPTGDSVLRYAFFPLYPMLLKCANFFFNNIELTAFILTQVILILNFFSIYYVLSKLFNLNLAVKTIFLFFTLPLSVFYRSYYTEGLFLFLEIWFLYHLVRKNFLLCGVFLGLLNITRGSGLPLVLVLLFAVYKGLKSQRISLMTAHLSIIASMIPIFFWMGFNYINTGSPFFFHQAHSYWFPNYFPLITLIYNLGTVFFFPIMPLHNFHFSQINIFLMVLSIILLFKSRAFLPKEFWWTSFILFLTPLATRDLMSFGRFTVVNLPIFLYLSNKVDGSKYLVIVLFFLFLLLLTSLFFINWYWIG